MSDDARAEIISKFPATLAQKVMITDDDGQPRLDLQALSKNSTWKLSIAQALNDIVTGLNDPDWLQKAYGAHFKRLDGKYDNWKDNAFEKFWGVKQRLASNVVAGSSAQHTLREMIERGVVKPGDVFKYSRTFKEGPVTVKKDAEVRDLCPACSKLVY